MTAPDREKALGIALAQIEKQFGKGSVMRLGDEGRAPVEVIPTGSIALDVALGIGGLPRGRVVEIYGPESSGKTTVTLHAVASVQAAGGIAAFIDAEHALDPEYAKALGVDTDSLLVSQPDTGEQALEIADMLIRSGAIDLVVVDSVAALVPRAEIEGEMGDSHVGLQARLMSQALRKIAGALSNTNTTMIFINQLREKIGVMFGSPETTTGGKALKFYASVRLDIRRIEALKDGTDVVGNRTRVKVVKNKMAPPFKQAEFDIIYGLGISREGSLIDVGVEQGLVRKAGAWYTYDGEQLGQGKENVRTFLRENPDVAYEIEKRIKEKLGVGARLDAEEPLPAPVDFRSVMAAPHLPHRSEVPADNDSDARSARIAQLAAQLESLSRSAIPGATGEPAAATVAGRAAVRGPDEGAESRAVPTSSGGRSIRGSRSSRAMAGPVVGSSGPSPTRNEGGHPEDPPGDPETVAKAICLRLLTVAARPRAVLAVALRKRGIPDDVAETVLDRFVDVGLIDDQAYAQAYVATKQRDRGLGTTALRTELRRKGIDEEVVAGAVDGIDHEAERSRAKALIERRVDAAMSAGSVAARRRLAGLLARRGYSVDVAVSVVDEALAAYTADERWDN